MESIDERWPNSPHSMREQMTIMHDLEQSKTQAWQEDDEERMNQLSGLNLQENE